MVSNIFVKVGQNQQKFEHSIALFFLWFRGAFFKVFHDSERVRQKPFEALPVDRATRATPLERLVCTDEGFVKEVIEAQLLACEGQWDRVRTRLPSAGNHHRRIHVTPQRAFGHLSPQAVRRD